MFKSFGVRSTNMNRVISYAMAIASACCAGSSYAQSLHGTVVGDDGKPPRCCGPLCA